MKNRVVRIGELFCGAGGTAHGAHISSYKGISYKHIWAIDNDKDACATFINNLPSVNIICKEIEGVDFNSLSAVDGLIFGFPCNDFSVVGEKKGINGKYGALYKYCVKAVSDIKPLFFVAENVGGLKSTNNKKDFSLIIDELKDCGYNVSYCLYKFEKYGIPQRRHRVIIVGFRSDLKVEFSHPLPTEEKCSSEEALRGIPADAPNHELPTTSDKVVERLKYIKEGENAFTAKMPDHLRLGVSLQISSIYKRLKRTKPSPTITAGGGGGTHGYHWSENRKLTNRERARLQTFPDEFEFIGSRESVRKQIGMAVPPQGAKIIFTEVLKLLYDLRKSL